MSPLIQHFWIPSFSLRCVEIDISHVKLCLNLIKSVKDQIAYQNSIEKETDLQKAMSPVNARDNWLKMFVFDIFIDGVYVSLVDFQWLNKLVCDNDVQ